MPSGMLSCCRPLGLPGGAVEGACFCAQGGGRYWGTGRWAKWSSCTVAQINSLQRGMPDPALKPAVHTAV